MIFGWRSAMYACVLTCRFLQRATLGEEKRTLQRESEDLSRQVQLLLREVQLLREKGGETRWGDDLRAAEPPPLVDMGGELVPEHLIAFTSIQQLQQNNQELLRVCLSRCHLLGIDLSFQTVHKLQDEKQREAGAERAAELRAVKEELAKLKEQRNQAEVLMQGIVRQRDMYRALAQARACFLCKFSRLLLMDIVMIIEPRAGVVATSAVSRATYGLEPPSA